VTYDGEKVACGDGKIFCKLYIQREALAATVLELGHGLIRENGGDQPLLGNNGKGGFPDFVGMRAGGIHAGKSAARQVLKVDPYLVQFRHQPNSLGCSEQHLFQVFLSVSADFILKLEKLFFDLSHRRLLLHYADRHGWQYPRSSTSEISRVSRLCTLLVILEVKYPQSQDRDGNRGVLVKVCLGAKGTGVRSGPGEFWSAHHGRGSSIRNILFPALRQRSGQVRNFPENLPEARCFYH